MISAVIGFLTALPEIVSLIQSFMDWINKVSGNDPAAHLAKIAESFDSLAKADTSEAKSAAAQSLAKLFTHH